MSPLTKQHGFTLLELMITVAILAILLGLAVPSFNETIRSNRTANQTNELVTALNTARSEASKRGLPVSVCAASDATQTACGAATTTDWANGWLTFTDADATHGQINTTAGATDTVILKSSPVSGGMQVTSNSIGFVRFGPNGASTDSSNIQFTIRHSTCTGNNLRTVRLEGSGRVNFTKTACP